MSLSSLEGRGEEDVSHDYFDAASADASLDVLSWQACDGKGYFAADVKLRLSTGERFEPDLIVTNVTTVWLIEAKTLHSEALTDEAKLVRLRDDLGDDRILELIGIHSGVDVRGRQLVSCVAFDRDDLSRMDGCSAGVVHLCWQTLCDAIARDGLASVLMRETARCGLAG